MNQRDLSLPGPHDERQSRDEIAAEIADHLASSAAELTKGGAAAEEAHTAARKKFGDVAQITKACYWIQNGETIMLRWTLVSLAAVLCILLGLSVLGNWRSQSQLADEMGKLSAELKALAAAKQAPPPAPQPPEITGVIYTGSKDKPLANGRVAILRADDGTVVRRMVCDDKGNYRSGPLEPGDYCVTTPITNAPQSLVDWVAQSEPVFLYGGSGSTPRDLDREFHAGGIKIVADRPLPELTQAAKYLIKSRLEVSVSSSRRRTSLWTPAQNTPFTWPVYCKPDVPSNDVRHTRTFGSSDNLLSTYRNLDCDDKQSTVVRERWSSVPSSFPIGKVQVSLALVFTVMPIDEKGDVLLHSSRISGIPHLRSMIADASGTQFIPIPWSKLADESLWYLVGDGQPWMAHIAGKNSFERNGPQSPPQQEIDIREKEFTVLHVEIPDGAEKEIQKAVEETTQVQAFADLVNEGLLQRPLKIKSTSYEPLEDAAKLHSP